MPLVRVGVAIAPHGVQGFLKCSYTTSQPEWIAERENYLLVDPQSHQAMLLHPRGVRLLPDGFLIQFTEFGAPEPLRALAGWELCYPVRRGELPREPGEVFLFELAGLEVRSPEGEPQGRIKDVLDNGVSILLELDCPGEPLIPYTAQFIPEVRLDEGYLVSSYPLPEPPKQRRVWQPRHRGSIQE